MPYLPDAERTKRLTTSELRAHFVVEDLFTPGEIRLAFYDLDRVVLGGVVPLDAPIALPSPPELAAAFFTERREVGVLNVGGPGAVTVDGQRHAIAARDGLYIGRGSREVVFESDRSGEPACFYLVSYPAHASHPTTPLLQRDAQAVELGTAEQANRRKLYKYVHPDGVASAQLVMGFTELLEGNVWNTMPPHTHARRSEVYLYFDVPDDAVVFHFMGEPQETRSLVLRNRQAVLSPPWSIHAGAGTRRYAFCWAMGGENQDFSDMQGVDMPALR